MCCHCNVLRNDRFVLRFIMFMQDLDVQEPAWYYMYMNEMDFYIDTQSIINIMADGKSIEYLFLEWYRCFLSKS